MDDIGQTIEKKASFFPRMHHHPLATRAPSELAASLERLVEQKRVLRREYGPNLSIYKYADAKVIEGDARLARGLLLQNDPPKFVNAPIPKFDELVPYSEDMRAYHASIAQKLPDKMHVQPKHDGTCIHAVCRDGVRYIHSFLCGKNAQTTCATSLLRDHTWENGLTLGFELISATDPKVQRVRATDGLYLFYGAKEDGTYLDRAELSAMASELGVFLVKQQTLSASKVCQLLCEMDDVDDSDNVKEGVIVMDVRAPHCRYKVKSWQYLTLAGAIAPDTAWWRRQVRRVKSSDELQRAIDDFDGPLDYVVRAHRLHCKLLSEARQWMDALHRHPRDTIEAIKMAPEAMQPILFRLFKNADLVDTEAELMLALRAFADSFAVSGGPAVCETLADAPNRGKGAD